MDYSDIVNYAVKHTSISITLDDALSYVQKRRRYIVDTIAEKANKRHTEYVITDDLIA